MEILQNPPFEVGQVVESRSFSTGYRGAWFRGMIKDIARRRGHLEYSLEFIDFPDEKIVWTRAFQLPPIPPLSKRKKRKDILRQLMVRPQYPPICHGKEIPDANSVHEDTVAIVGAWKVGDNVDWWADGCYWSGKVTKVFDNDKFQVDLLPPPLGEGSSYQVDCIDLRPSLDWSLEFGWSNPMPECEESCSTARLIKPLNLGNHTNVDICALGKNGEPKKVVENIEPMSDQPLKIVLASSLSTSLLVSEDVQDDPMTEEAVEANRGEMEQVAEANAVPMDLGDAFSNVKANSSDCVSSSDRRDVALAEKTEGETKEEDHRPVREVSLNSMYSDTFDAAVMDLEELIIRIKWLKDMLKRPQLTSNSNNSGSSSWEVVEHRHS